MGFGKRYIEQLFPSCAWQRQEQMFILIEPEL
jgi:hypothetical protein